MRARHRFQQVIFSAVNRGPVCSARRVHADLLEPAPAGYVDKAEDLRAKGVDTIVCLAVNDAFVMGAWGQQQGANGKVMMVADGNAELTKKLGLEMDGSGFGMGTLFALFDDCARRRG